MQPPDLKIFGNAEIPGLNINAALARLDYDEEAYIEVLRVYAGHITKFIEKARREISGDILEYRIAVHGIKGSCRGIGAEELGAEAELLEKAAKEGNISLIQNNTAALLESVEKFRIGVENFIRDTDAKNNKNKPEMEEPDPELIKKIIGTAESYDIDGLKSAISILEACTYSSAPGLAEWLHEQADCSNFDEIVNKLNQKKSETI